jgi:hypothetical protein
MEGPIAGLMWRPEPLEIFVDPDRADKDVLFRNGCHGLVRGAADADRNGNPIT